MAIRLVDLLKQVPPEVKLEVTEARNRHRSVVQEILRSECRLSFKNAEEIENNRSGAQVPVIVSDAYPAELEDVEFEDELEALLLIAQYRNQLESTERGVKGASELQLKLLRLQNQPHWTEVNSQSLDETYNWSKRLIEQLDKWDPVKRILGANENVMGVYRYKSEPYTTDDTKPNKASIELYWCVIGLVSKMLGCSVQDLTIKVLTHELAHAYTQVGADIDGRRWLASRFNKVEVEVKEGLAQYYTELVLQRLKRRLSGPLDVYQMLLPRQPSAYRTHEDWIKEYDVEAIRIGMLEFRRAGQTTLEDFEYRLKSASMGLSGY